MTEERALASFEELLEGQARGFDVDCGQRRPLRLLVVRRNGDLFVYENRCPHRGTPLDWFPNNFLDQSGEHLICATHGALFRIEDGECLAGPCVGEHLRPLPHRLRGSTLHVTLPAEHSRGA